MMWGYLLKYGAASLSWAAKNRQVVYIALLCAALLSVGYMCGSTRQPPPRPVPVGTTIHRAQQTPGEPTGQLEAPDLTITYQTLTDTVRDTVYVPRSLQDRYNITAPQPLNITSDAVTYHYYNPRRSRYQTEVYRVPAPKWSYYADVHALYTIQQAAAVEVQAGLTYRRVGLTVRGGYRQRSGAYAMAGISYRLWGR